MSINANPMTPETDKVIKSINNQLTQKEVIKNYFGLRDSVVMDVDGKTILEVFNEFVDPDALAIKGVAWTDKLATLGVSKEYFDGLLGKYLKHGQKDSSESNGTTDALEGVADSKKPARGRKAKPTK